jgi:hypothetical protein
VTVPNRRTDVYDAYIEALKLNAEGTMWMIADLLGCLYVHPPHQPVYSASHVL